VLPEWPIGSGSIDATGVIGAPIGWVSGDAFFALILLNGSRLPI
jgi:hypothetical protein